MKKVGTAPVISVNLAIYRRYVVIFFGHSVDQMISHGIRRGINKKHFTPEWKGLHDVTADGADGYCRFYGDGNHDVLIWLRERPRRAKQYGVLYHELYHAVELIAKVVDPKDFLITADGHSEARANLLQYLADEINQILWK